MRWYCFDNFYRLSLSFYYLRFLILWMTRRVILFSSFDKNRNYLTRDCIYSKTPIVTWLQWHSCIQILRRKEREDKVYVCGSNKLEMGRSKKERDGERVESDIKVLIARANEGCEIGKRRRERCSAVKWGKRGNERYVEAEAPTRDRGKWTTKDGRKRRQQKRHRGPLTSSTRESES